MLNDTLYQELFDNNLAIALIIDPQDGRIVDANPAACEFYGYTRETLRNMYITQINTQAVRKTSLDMQVALEKQQRQFNFNHRLASGAVRNVLVRSTPITLNGRRLLYSVVTDVTDVRRLENSLYQVEQNYNRLLDMMQQGVLVHSADDRVVYANDYLCALLGYTRQELTQKNAYELHPLETRPILYEHIERRRVGESSTYEIQFIKKDGKLTYAIVSGAPIISSEGNYQGSFSIITDITARIQAEEQLRRSNDDLRAFAHTVAHDLKDPLAVLIGFANLVRTEYTTLTPDQFLEAIETIERTADKMVGIIDELLMLSEMRDHDIELEPLHMDDVVREACARLAYMIEQYSATIEIEELPLLPAALGHAAWVEEIWVNYITNAIKYGGSPPHVRIGGTVTEGCVAWWVRDNGRGITADDLERIFVPFERLETVRASGHGLGLSIVKRIVEKLNGDVWVESEEGKGSTFYFRLPCAPL